MTTIVAPTDPGTTGSTPVADPIPGYVSSKQLRESPVYFDEGPTGRSLIWPERLLALMHESVTTDPGFNQVDLTWAGAGMIVYIEVKGVGWRDTSDTQIRPLHDVVRDLRAQLGMSVDDVAAMCGVGRRQLYNLMSGASARTSGEAHIRRLAHLVDELATAVDGSRERLRSIALHPVEGDTFYDVARAKDARHMDAIARRLIDAVETGQLSGVVRRPSPRRRASARPGALAELSGDDDES